MMTGDLIGPSLQIQSSTLQVEIVYEQDPSLPDDQCLSLCHSACEMAQAAFTRPM